MWEELRQKYNITINCEEINKLVDPVLREMEQNGIKIDPKVFSALSKDFEKKIQLCQKEIFAIAGSEFNLNSPIQLSEILFNKLKLPADSLRKTKSGISTAAAELEKISDKSPVIPPILQYRELTKLQNTYLKPLPALADQNSRVHTCYAQDTSTGRITSSEPNLQNIPIKGEYGPLIRKGFIADANKCLISADYSQIELRIAASVSEDALMKKAFVKNRDIHTETASEIFEVAPEKITPDQRRVAKAVNFGILYGQSAYGLSQALKIDRSHAALYIKNYFDAYCGIKNYCSETIDFAHKNQYVETLFGMKRFLPNINSHQFALADGEERMAVNTPIQGTAAEILKLAMIKLHQEIKKLPSKPKMLLTVHDEIVVETDTSSASQVAELIKNVMENTISLSVPLVAEVKIGPNWGEMKKNI